MNLMAKQNLLGGPRPRVSLEYGAALTVVLLLASALVAAGAALVYLPAGLVVGGLLLAACGAVCIDVGGRPRA